MNDGGNSDDDWAQIFEEGDAIVQQHIANRSLSAIQQPAVATPQQPPPQQQEQQQIQQPSQAHNGYTLNNSSTIAYNPQPTNSRPNHHQYQYHDSSMLENAGDIHQNSVMPQYTASQQQHRHQQQHPAPQGFPQQVQYQYQYQYQPNQNQNQNQPHAASQFQNQRRDTGLYRASQFRNHQQNAPSQYRPHNQSNVSNVQQNIQQQQTPIQISPQGPTQSPAARDLAAAKGALENYKRKYQKIEQENMQLRVKLAAKHTVPVPEKLSTDERTLDALKSDLAAARTAARKAEQRAEFAERELSSREEAAEFIEATQIQIQAPCSQGITNTRPSHSQGISNTRPSQSQGISMVRGAARPPKLSQLPRATTPSKPKRRRASVPPISPKDKSKPPSTSTQPASSGKSKSSKSGSASLRTRGREEERDDADWEVVNGAWLEAYDSESRKAERIRAHVLTPARVKVLTRIGARNRKLRNVLQDALTSGDEAVWKDLADALLDDYGSLIALEIIVELHLHGAISISLDERAVNSAIEVLKQEGANEAAFYILGNGGGDTAARMGDPSIARVVHEGLLNGSIAAAACLSAHNNNNKESIELLERLVVAALQLGGGTEGGTGAATRYKLAGVAAAEKMAHLLPGAILTMLDDDYNNDNEVSARVGRIVAEVGARDSDIVSLMKGGLVLCEKKMGGASGNGHANPNPIWKMALDMILKEWSEEVKTRRPRRD